MTTQIVSFTLSTWTLIDEMWVQVGTATPDSDFWTADGEEYTNTMTWSTPPGESYTVEFVSSLQPEFETGWVWLEGPSALVGTPLTEILIGDGVHHTIESGTTLRVGPASAPPPEYGTLLTTYCDGTTKMGTYADGEGGTYDEIIEANSLDCGYEPPPEYGTLLSTYCDGTTKMGTYADGIGGTYNAVIETNSLECGYEPPPENPPYGTFITSYCDGTTKMGTYADGEGGTYDAVIEINSTECGYEPPPENGTLLSTYCDGTTKMGTYADGIGGTYDAVIEINSLDCGYEPPPESGTLLSTYCDGTTKMGTYADGIGGTYDSVIELNSLDCGYEPPSNPPLGTLLSTHCDGTTKMGTYADGEGGTYDEIIELNSLDCGYEPPNNPPLGTLLSTYCDGTTKMGVYADGNGGTYNELIEINSTDCGYTPPSNPPSGTLLSTFCDGTTKMGVYADGIGGTYNEVIEFNSTECGYVPPVENPPAGTLLGTFCSGTTKCGTYADGDGGTYTAVIQINSTQCGYTPPNPGGGGVIPPENWQGNTPLVDISIALWARDPNGETWLQAGMGLSWQAELWLDNNDGTFSDYIIWAGTPWATHYSIVYVTIPYNSELTPELRWLVAPKALLGSPIVEINNPGGGYDAEKFPLAGEDLHVFINGSDANCYDFIKIGPVASSSEIYEHVSFLLSGMRDANNRPLTFGKVYTYLAGTTTRAPLYRSAGENQYIEAIQPVVLDAAGTAAVLGNGAYKFVICDSEGGVVVTLDNVILGGVRDTDSLNSDLVQTLYSGIPDAVGKPLTDGKVYYYKQNGTDLMDWTDIWGNPLPNPILLSEYYNPVDAEPKPVQAYAAGIGTLVIKDKDDVVLRTAENFRSGYGYYRGSLINNPRQIDFMISGAHGLPGIVPDYIWWEGMEGGGDSGNPPNELYYDAAFTLPCPRWLALDHRNCKTLYGKGGYRLSFFTSNGKQYLWDLDIYLGNAEEEG